MRKDLETTLVTGKRKPFWFVKELIKYRELIFFLTLRDILVQYKQTFIGLAWAIFKPVTTMVIFTFVFGKIAGLPSNEIPYPILVLSGILPWQFFATSLINSSNSIVSNRELVTKIYFPRMALPLSSFGVAIIDFFISFVILVILIVSYGLVFSWKIVFIPLAIFFCIVLSSGLGLLFSSLNAKYRDVSHALPFFIQLSLFISPVAYSDSIIKGNLKIYFSLNPLTGLIGIFRWCLFDNISIEWQSLCVSLSITLFLFIIGYFYFTFSEKYLADVI
ncbi:ABC transporter permease [candidate division WOR-3 bacterium]|nr:ABC transporter permease [candidate division WOR-3 bacterium]